MIISFSSHLISTITTARNPQGNEEQWLKSDQKLSQHPTRKTRFLAEIAYTLTAIAAVIETTTSVFFVLATLPLILISSKPFNKAVKWSESSAFSIIWSVAALHFNLQAANLLTREDFSRNLAFRGDTKNFGENGPKAPLVNRLFMIPREMPSYLSTAYALRFKDLQEENGIFSRLWWKIKRYKQLIGEVLYASGNQSIFERNIVKLDSDFAKLNDKLVKTKRAICAYFVSAQDYNGAILGDPVYYYHHYKIGGFEKHFDVSAKVVRTTEEMFKHLNDLKTANPDRPIKLVVIVAHGSSQLIDINLPTQQDQEVSYSNTDVRKNEFNGCAPDADIILDACSTGVGDNSIANLIAEQNPGKRVFAPGAPLFFSKPVFKIKNGIPKIAHVTHGFAIVRAYTSREFEAI